jgi:hypothetical protein
MPVKFRRQQLLRRVDRWRTELSEIDDAQLTRCAGAKDTCYTQIELIIRDAISALVNCVGSEAESLLPKSVSQLMLGEMIRTFEDIGRKFGPMVQRKRPDIAYRGTLISESEVSVLWRFNELRKESRHTDFNANLTQVLILTKEVCNLYIIGVCEQLEVPRIRG